MTCDLHDNNPRNKERRERTQRRGDEDSDGMREESADDIKDENEVQKGVTNTGVWLCPAVTKGRVREERRKGRKDVEEKMLDQLRKRDLMTAVCITACYSS